MLGDSVVAALTIDALPYSQVPPESLIALNVAKSINWKTFRLFYNLILVEFLLRREKDPFQFSNK